LIHWKTVINLIISNVSLAGNNTKKTFPLSIFEFIVLKACKVDIHLPKTPIIKEVIWSPTIENWIKVNIDGAAVNSHNKTTAGENLGM